MYKIYKRDEFVTEVYNPMKEQKEYEDLMSINEGLLKNLFGAVKNMFKKDWASIKGDPGIIKVYKEMDDALTGFSLMKLSKKDVCNQIRQELVDFAGDWYDIKMNKAKEAETDPKPAKSMKFKDETLRENLENTRKKINTIANGDEQMLKWANLLMDDMKNVINRTILSEIESEETRKEVEEMVNKEVKHKEEVNKKMEEWQNKQLNDIKVEREKLISDMGASPIRTDIGDKAIEELAGEFEKVKTKKGNADRAKFKRDELLGLKNLFTDDETQNTDKFGLSYKLMNSVYTSLKDHTVAEKFKETPGKSVQAMCISINAFIKHCVYGDTDFSKSLPLMAKCAIISNGSVSYNIPLNDKKGDDAGNYFTDIVKIITNGKMKDAEGKAIELPDDFKGNSKRLLNKIIDEAEKLKEDSEKSYNNALKKLDLGEEEK